ncbi:hypothetical protein THAOC_23843, partial [Thalassiosira oceanica]
VLPSSPEVLPSYDDGCGSRGTSARRAGRTLGLAPGPSVLPVAERQTSPPGAGSRMRQSTCITSNFRATEWSASGGPAPEESPSPRSGRAGGGARLMRPSILSHHAFPLEHYINGSNRSGARRRLERTDGARALADALGMATKGSPDPRLHNDSPRLCLFWPRMTPQHDTGRAESVGWIWREEGQVIGGRGGARTRGSPRGRL